MSEEAPRLRLKPKLAPETPAQPAPAPVAPPPLASAPPPPAAVPPPAAPAPVFAEPPPLPPAEAPASSFRLKPKTPSLPPDPGRPPPVPPAAVAPVAAAPGRSAAALAAEGRKVQLAALCIGAAGSVLFGVIGYLTYSGQLRAESLLFTDNEADMIGEPIDSTEDDDALEATAAIAPAPVAEPAETVARTPEPARSAAIAPASLDTVEPSDEFRAAVAALKITGVRAGSNPRVLIAGASYKPGDVVHAPLGIVFSGYDADRRLVRFQDATGARLERPDR